MNNNKSSNDSTCIFLLANVAKWRKHRRAKLEISRVPIRDKGRRKFRVDCAQMNGLIQ